MVLRALGGLALVICLIGLARNPLQFFLLRLLQGAFTGVVGAAEAFAAAQAPAEHRGLVLGKLETAVASGTLADPALGGLAADLLGMRQLCLILGAVLALWAAWAAYRLREDRQPHRASGSERGESFLQVLRSRRVRSFLWAGICANIGAYGLVVLFAGHVRSLVSSPDYAASWVGILQAVTWGGALLGAAWWGKRNDSTPVERNFAVASVLCGLSILVQALPQPVEWLLLWKALQDFGFSALLPSVMLVVSESASESQRGVYLGVANSALVIGQIAGSLISAAVGRSLEPSYGILVMGLPS